MKQPNGTPSNFWENFTPEGYLRTERVPHFGGDVDNQASTADIFIRLSTGSLSLANGGNDDITLDHATFQRITGPSAAFTVSGFTGGTGGRMLYLYNAVAQDMTIENENAGSTAANRILTLTGADVTLTGVSFATFVYHDTDARWILVATRA